jgi:hypothetical protein
MKPLGRKKPLNKKPYLSAINSNSKAKKQIIKPKK